MRLMKKLQVSRRAIAKVQIQNNGSADACVVKWAHYGAIEVVGSGITHSRCRNVCRAKEQRRTDRNDVVEVSDATSSHVAVSDHVTIGVLTIKHLHVVHIRHDFERTGTVVTKQSICAIRPYCD